MELISLFILFVCLQQNNVIADENLPPTRACTEDELIAFNSESKMENPKEWIVKTETNDHCRTKIAALALLNVEYGFSLNRTSDISMTFDKPIKGKMTEKNFVEF